MTDRDEIIRILKPKEVATRDTWGVLFGVEALADAILEWHNSKMSEERPMWRFSIKDE